MPYVEGDSNGNSTDSGWHDSGAGGTLDPVRSPSPVTRIMQTEPAALIGYITAALGAVVAVASNIIVDLPPDASWIEVAFAAAVVILPVAQAKFTRQKVVSPASYEALAIKE